MAQPIEQWITGIPPVTRTWVAAAVGASILVVSVQSQARPLLARTVIERSWLALLTEPGMPARCARTAVVLVEGGSGQYAGKLKPSATVPSYKVRS